MQYIVHKNMTYNDLVSKQLFYWNDKNPTHHNSHIHTYTYMISRYCYIYRWFDVEPMRWAVTWIEYNGEVYHILNFSVLHYNFMYFIQIDNEAMIFIYIYVRVWEKPHRSKSYFHFFLLAPALHRIVLPKLQFS